MSWKLKKNSKPFTCLDVGSSRLICIIAEINEDEIKTGEIAVGEMFCIKCGTKLEFSGANCKKCTNCGESGGCG